MTTAPDPAVELTARVELGSGRVVLRVPGEPAAAFDEPTLTWLFRRGLQLGHGSGEGAVPVGELRAKGDVAFLVGRFDIGTHAGLRAVRDGLLEAIDVAVQDLWRQKPTAPPARGGDPGQPKATPVEDSIAAHGEALGQPLEWKPVTTVDIDELLASFDAWLSRVDEGTPITLTRDGRPAAALVAWESFRAQRERLALIDAAFRKAMEGGQFDPARLADIADEQITPPGEPSTKPLPDDGDDGAAGGG